MSSIEAHGRMLHLLRATTVHLCKRTSAFPEHQHVHLVQSLFYPCDQGGLMSTSPAQGDRAWFLGADTSETDSPFPTVV